MPLACLNPAKLHRHWKGIFLKRAGEDACAAGNLRRRKTETGFDAHTVFSTEARPSFPHRKDKWPQDARGGASATTMKVGASSDVLQAMKDTGRQLSYV